MMKGILRYRPHPATAIALAALAVALGGVAFAAIPDSNGTIHGCYQKSNGDLRVVESQTNCHNSENPLNWNVQGGGRMAAGVGVSQNERDFYSDPPANPDSDPSISAQVTISSPGRLLITANAAANFDCPVGPCHFDVGLYLDGQPLPRTDFSFDADSGGGGGSGVPNSYLTDSVPAGTHTVSFLTKRDAGSVTAVGGDFSVSGPYDGS